MKMELFIKHAVLAVMPLFFLPGCSATLSKGVPLAFVQKCIHNQLTEEQLNKKALQYLKEACGSPEQVLENCRIESIDFAADTCAVLIHITCGIRPRYTVFIDENGTPRRWEADE